jgi:hypothetical protein
MHIVIALAFLCSGRDPIIIDHIVKAILACFGF